MAATPIIQSEGSSSGFGTAGEDRSDGVLSETVDLSDTEAANSGASYVWNFEDKPPGSTATLNNPSTATPDFTPDLVGTYAVRAVVDGSFEATYHFSVRTTKAGIRIASFLENAAGRNFNESSNVKGWFPSYYEAFSVIDAEFGHLDTQQTWTKSQTVAQATLTDAANISVDASSSNNFQLELTGSNGQLDNPTNVVPGMVLNFAVRQDGTGGHTLSFGSAYLFPGGAPTISADPSAEDLISCYVRTESSGTAVIMLCSIAQAHEA